MEALFNHPTRWNLFVNHRTSHIANQNVHSRRWRCCKAADVTNFPFEGHRAMTNADEANEVQENAVTTKKGKKRSINAITSIQVNNP